jgi:hypothetical protein
MVPGCDLLGGGETETGFFYQFFYSKVLSTDLAKMLEERMRQIVREDRPLRQMEMVAVSAKEMFQKAHHAAAVDALDEREPKELISVVRIGSFIDLAEGPFCSSIRDVGAFQVTALKVLGDGEYRVEGCVAETKDELKSFLRKLRRYDDENHLALGNELKLWDSSEGGLVWLPSGLELRRRLASFLKERIAPKAIEVEVSSEPHFERYAEKIFKKKGSGSFWRVAERGGDIEGDLGLFEACCQNTIQQTIYLDPKDFDPTLFSLLQSIHKTLIILGFHPELRLCGRGSREKGLKRLEQGLLEQGLKALFESDERSAPRLQWRVRDGLGLLRLAAELKVETTLSLKLSVERILGLLLEQTLGNLQKTLEKVPKEQLIERLNRTFKLENQ